jgi:hypothetical protein
MKTVNVLTRKMGDFNVFKELVMVILMPIVYLSNGMIIPII